VSVLRGLSVADPPELWETLGFKVTDGRIALGGMTLELGARGRGIVAWSLPELDGLRSFEAASQPDLHHHPNGATGIDHVVVVTPDFDRTVMALEAAGLALSRVRDAGGFRQGFRRLGPAILELVELVGADVTEPARFWGFVVIVQNLEAVAQRLGERLGPIHAAVQPGRRIATLKDSAGLSVKLAFMDPEPS
jgi:hypothetical protein